MKKIFTIILLVLFALTLASCKKVTKTEGGNGQETEEKKRYSYTEGVHKLDFTETNSFLVQKGKTDYSIVIPETTDMLLLYAVDELTNLFEKATGIKLSMIQEDSLGLEHKPQNKYISLGNTKLFESSGIEMDKKALGVDGLIVKTLDNTIYINGGMYGVLYGVYDFLSLTFGFECYSYDCIKIEETGEKKLYNYDCIDIPDIDSRINPWGFTTDNPNNVGYRQRMPYALNGPIMPVAYSGGGAAIHNTLDIIPRGVGKTEWFSDQGDQLCYTAHGDDESLAEMIQFVADVIIRGLMMYAPENYPLYNTVTVTMEDNSATCLCSSCQANTRKYGAESGSVIVFCNRVRAAVQEWMDKDENKMYRRDDFVLVFFAYNTFVDAPAHFDETLGKYVVNHPDLEIRPDCGVFYAVSKGFQYQLPLYDERNAEGLENSLKWFDISPNTYIWTYNANFGGYFGRTNSGNFYSNDAYELFKYGNARLLYNQGGWNQYNLTAFQGLNIFIDYKLMWDTTLDINPLIDEWFENEFMDAKDEMYELYVKENNYGIILADKAGKLQNTGIINFSISSQASWPYQMLLDWISIIDRARLKIEKYKDADPETYKMLKEHIDLEWVSPAYFLLSLYGVNFLGNETYTQMANYFKENILPLKYFIVSERSGPLNDWILSL